MKEIREQRKHDKQMKLREKYEGDGEATDVEEILSVITVNNEDRNVDENDDSISEVSEADSYCRHCLRPQSELQLRYMRPRQRSKLRQKQLAKRERSKQRYSSFCTVGSGSGNNNMSAGGNQAQKTRSKKSRSKSRAKRARNNKHNTSASSNIKSNKQNNNSNKEQNVKLPLMRDLNVANEQAIRFRCPQVGPQVGRDRQMPPMLHFHHPQHVQKQLTAYQVQYTHIYGQRFGIEEGRDGVTSGEGERQQAISPMQTTTLTIESELKQHQQQHHLSNNQKSNRNQQHPQATQTDDLTATNTTAATNNLQNCCCSSIHQQTSHYTHRHHQRSPQRISAYKQQANSCTTTTPCCCYFCTTSTTMATATTTQLHNPYYHHYPYQHHNLPQLSLAHLETASATAVASLEATTLVVTETTANGTNIPSQVLAQPPPTPPPPPTLPLSGEHRNLNNLTTTTIAEEESPSNLVVATTTDSPSLVKVSTWYTVAKQGVSC